MVLKTVLSEGGQAEWETVNSTVVKASIQTPFSSWRIKSSRKEKLKEYTMKKDRRRGRWVTCQVSREISEGVNSRVVL